MGELWNNGGGITAVWIDYPLRLRSGQAFSRKERPRHEAPAFAEGL